MIATYVSKLQSQTKHNELPAGVVLCQAPAARRHVPAAW